MLLIHPPVAKPCEPPAGIARLAGLLRQHGISHRLFDANIEGLHHLLGLPPAPDCAGDAWSRRAFRHRQTHIASLRDIATYRNPDRYRRSVKDLGRVLAKVSPDKVTVGLANFDDKELSPHKSGDLLRAAECPELNPFYPFFRTRLSEVFRRATPSAVGVSLNYLSQALCAFSIIGILRREYPGVTTVLGGGLVTSWMSNPEWKNPFSGLVDHLVSGPGEKQLLTLLGMTEKQDGMPRPDYSGVPGDRYLAPGFVLPYSASSGCYWKRCAFCPEEAEANPYVAVPAKQVLADLERLIEETNPSLIHLLDNAVSPALLEALSEHPPGPPWYGFARVGEHLADPSFCREIKKAGCVMLKLGIESGDQDVLDALNKGIIVDTASRALRNLKAAGIAAYVYLLFGTPPETESSARKTLEFAAQHSDCIDYLNLAIFNMPLYGATSSDLRRVGFSEGDLSLYTDFLHPARWDRRRVRLFLERDFKSHPALSVIIRREPPVFTSNHAPFFVMER
jgi:hypothetical protein